MRGILRLDSLGEGSFSSWHPWQLCCTRCVWHDLSRFPVQWQPISMIRRFVVAAAGTIWPVKMCTSTEISRVHTPPIERFLRLLAFEVTSQLSIETLWFHRLWSHSNQIQLERCYWTIPTALAPPAERIGRYIFGFSLFSEVGEQNILRPVIMFTGISHTPLIGGFLVLWRSRWLRYRNFGALLPRRTGFQVWWCWVGCWGLQRGFRGRWRWWLHPRGLTEEEDAGEDFDGSSVHTLPSRCLPESRQWSRASFVDVSEVSLYYMVWIFWLLLFWVL